MFWLLFELITVIECLPDCLGRLQRIMNTAGRILCKISKFNYITKTLIGRKPMNVSSLKLLC